MTTQNFGQIKSNNADIEYDDVAQTWTFSAIVTAKATVTELAGVTTMVAHVHQAAGSGGTLDHGAALTGLTDDDHTQYAKLAGRSGGQTQYGGTGSGDDLRLDSTSHATPGTVFFGGGSADYYEEASAGWRVTSVGIGTPATASYPLQVHDTTVTKAQIAVTSATGGLSVLVAAADNTYFGIDTYFLGGEWYSWDAGSNFRIAKGGVVADALRIQGATGVAVGSPITWTNLIGLTASALDCYVGIITGGTASGADLRIKASGHSTQGQVYFGSGNSNYFDENLGDDGCWSITELHNDTRRNVKFYGAKGDGTNDDTAEIQAALDADTGTLFFPRGMYKVTGSGDQALLLTKKVNLIAEDPERTYIRGDSLGAGTSLLKVAFATTDVRNWTMEGLGLYCNASGKHCLWFEGGQAIYTSTIRNCMFTGYIGNGGYSVYCNTASFAHNVIESNTFDTPSYWVCGDANVWRKNLFSGTGIAITIDAAVGIYNNTISDNTIVNRDGAVHVKNGSVVRILNNQIECASGYTPSENQSTPPAMVYLEGSSEQIRNCLISGNNFGGGTNVAYLIYVDNALKPIITGNQLQSSGFYYDTGTVTAAADAGGSIITLALGTWPSWVASGSLTVLGSIYTVKSRTSDSVIVLDDTGVTIASPVVYTLRYDGADVCFTANCDYAVLASDNIQTSSVINSRTNTIWKTTVSDSGVGTAGVLQLESKYTGDRNSWTGGDFWKDAAGVVHFYEPFNSGTTTGATLMGTLPAGFRPAAAISVPAACGAGAGSVNIGTNGEITVGSVGSNVNVMVSPFTCATNE